jgi:KDO2-lipid IV(A) lauroyltransferase
LSKPVSTEPVDASARVWRVGFWLFAHAPHWLRLALAKGIAERSLLQDPSFCATVRANLTAFFPAAPGFDQQALLERYALEHMAVCLDQFRCWNLTETQLRSTVQLQGWAELQQLQKRQPVVVLAPHFLGMDIGAQRLSVEQQFASLYRPHEVAIFDTYRLQRRGRFNGQVLLPQHTPFLRLARLLQQGVPLFLQPDLDADAAGRFVPFGEAVASTSPAAAWLACRIGAALVPFEVVHLGPDRYLATLHPPIDGLVGSLLPDMARINQVVSALIAGQPTQYWWAHARYATRPFGQAQVYSDAS